VTLKGAMPPKAAPKGQNIPSWWAPVVWELWAEKKSDVRSCYDSDFYTAAVERLDEIYGGKGSADVPRKQGCKTAHAFGQKFIEQCNVKDIKPSKVKGKLQDYVDLEWLPVDLQTESLASYYKRLSNPNPNPNSNPNPNPNPKSLTLTLSP